MTPASEPISSATAITIAAPTPNMISTRNMSPSLRSGLRGVCGGICSFTAAIFAPP